MTSFSAPDMPSNRKRRALPTKIRCSLALVADHRFFKEMGQGSQEKTINYMVSLINPLTPGVFPKKVHFWDIFDIFEVYYQLKYLHHSIQPLKHQMRPWFSLKLVLNDFFCLSMQSNQNFEINHPTTVGFFFHFSFFSSSYLFTAVVSLLPGFFWVEKFPRKC